jgi:hypothetical protein
MKRNLHAEGLSIRKLTSVILSVVAVSQSEAAVEGLP